MIRLEVFFFALLSGLLISEMMERLGRIFFTMFLMDLDPGLQFFVVFIIAMIIVAIFVTVCLLRPGLMYTDPVEYLRRELFIFRKKVAIEWPDSWEADPT